MKKTFTLTNGDTVTFEEIRARFCGETTIQTAIKLHDEKDVNYECDYITAAEMPATVEEAEQLIADNYWSIYVMDGEVYVGE